MESPPAKVVPETFSRYPPAPERFSGLLHLPPSAMLPAVWMAPAAPHDDATTTPPPRQDAPEYVGTRVGWPQQYHQQHCELCQLSDGSGGGRGCLRASELPSTPSRGEIG